MKLSYVYYYQVINIFISKYHDYGQYWYIETPLVTKELQAFHRWTEIQLTFIN